jgi:hypothetical protein
MSHEQLQAADPRISRALNELADLVRRGYPHATFQVAPAEDDPSIVHLVTRVDVEDPEEVADLVMDRMLEMQIDEGLPIYLIPLRTPERIAALREAQQRHSSSRSEYLPATTLPASSAH